MKKLTAILVTGIGAMVPFGTSEASECESLSIPSNQVIWCDDFEDSDLPASGRIRDNYYDFNDEGGRMTRVTTEAASGQFSLQQHYRNVGDQSAGYFFRTFGRSPLSSQSHSDEDFREIYWRFYVKHSEDFVDVPSKLTRATVFATANRAQAMIAHVWIDGSDRKAWMLDPASGTDSTGILRTTGWNDFSNLRYLGQQRASSPIQKGKWQCIEVHAALNSPGKSDGKFTLWIDDKVAADRQDLNWLGSYADYGINAVMIESYWGPRSPAVQSRYIDSLVIAKQRIGCINVTRPARVTQLTVE